RKFNDTWHVTVRGEQIPLARGKLRVRWRGYGMDGTPHSGEPGPERADHQALPLSTTQVEEREHDAGNSRRPVVPGYEVLERLGQGGMGIVHRARHLALDRAVALKMIRFGQLATEPERARFRQEAEAAARLQHPNIVQVFEVGTAEEMPYLAMEF